MAPIVRPATRYFWKKTAKITAGISESKAPAETPPQIIPAPLKPAIMTGRVYACDFVRIKAIMNSFHDQVKLNRATTAIEGRDIGRTILVRTW